MKWMPKEQQCTLCNRPMRVQLVDDNSAHLVIYNNLIEIKYKYFLRQL